MIIAFASVSEHFLHCIFCIDITSDTNRVCIFLIDCHETLLEKVYNVGKIKLICDLCKTYIFYFCNSFFINFVTIFYAILIYNNDTSKLMRVSATFAEKKRRGSIFDV